MRSHDFHAAGAILGLTCICSATFMWLPNSVCKEIHKSIQLCVCHRRAYPCCICLHDVHGFKLYSSIIIVEDLWNNKSLSKLFIVVPCFCSCWKWDKETAVHISNSCGLYYVRPFFWLHYHTVSRRCGCLWSLRDESYCFLGMYAYLRTKVYYYNNPHCVSVCAMIVSMCAGAYRLYLVTPTFNTKA